MRASELIRFLQSLTEDGDDPTVFSTTGGVISAVVPGSSPEDFVNPVSLYLVGD